MSVIYDRHSDYVSSAETQAIKNPNWLGFYRPRERVSVSCVNGRTRQEFKDECNLSTLMKKYEKNPMGLLAHSRGKGFSVDAFDLPSYMEAMQVMSDAQSAFDALPSRVRGEFDNDPARFVAFAQDEKNADRMREWGLLEPVQAPAEPLEVRVVNAPGDEKPA